MMSAIYEAASCKSSMSYSAAKLNIVVKISYPCYSILCGICCNYMQYPHAPIGWLTPDLCFVLCAVEQVHVVVVETLLKPVAFLCMLRVNKYVYTCRFSYTIIPGRCLVKLVGQFAQMNGLQPPTTISGTKQSIP